MYEAKALALTVKDLPQRFAGGTVDVYVDNTSVQGVARKKQCVRNRLLNDAVITALARLRDFSYFRHPSAARGCTRVQKIGQRARSARGPIFLHESAPEGCTGVADVCLLPDSALFEALGTFFVEIFF